MAATREIVCATSSLEIIVDVRGERERGRFSWWFELSNADVRFSSGAAEGRDADADERLNTRVETLSTITNLESAASALTAFSRPRRAPLARVATRLCPPIVASSQKVLSRIIRSRRRHPSI
jgi:hypothetical protein|tara:strand:+ start:367 stop:732 length:366 start_codon:yes stop_codon:yes gene_type:complete